LQLPFQVVDVLLVVVVVAVVLQIMLPTKRALAFTLISNGVDHLDLALARQLVADHRNGVHVYVLVRTALFYFLRREKKAPAGARQREKKSI